MHATDYLAAKERRSDVPLMVVYGSERSLKVDVLHGIPGCAPATDDVDSDEDVSLTRVNGSDAELVRVTDELLTVSMFGDRRIVLVDDADDFVKDNRPGLEKYATKPARSSLLILDMKSWPKNTRLAKVVAKTGVAIECNALSGAALKRWLQQTARTRFGKSIDANVTDLMIGLAGTSLGILQQELAKLATLVGDADAITSEDVAQTVGDWKTHTTWEMLDSVRDGQVGTAITSLDRLLLAGEHPIKIMGGITYVFRKLGEATEIARQTRDVSGALRSAGVFPASVGPSESYLRRIGFDKASRILQLLAETDANLKGGSRVEPRVQLEHLFVVLAG